MKIQSYILVGCFVFFLSLLSCKKNIPGHLAPDKYEGRNFSEVFEAFWTGMNNNYVFWSIDTVNWDRMYQVYKPRFDELDINDMISQRKAVQYFREMTADLIDSHYVLSLKYGIDINPALNRKRGKINEPLADSFFNKAILNNYLDPGASWGQKKFINPLNNTNNELLLVTGTIQHKILYLHSNNFFVKLLHDSAYIAPVWKQFLELLHNLPPAFKGFILDLRSNSGGLIDDLSFIAGKIINNPVYYGDTRVKNNIGRLDYTPWAPSIVVPDINAVNLNKPIVILADQNSRSMAEITAMALKRLPGTYIIGDTTWGANGLVNSHNEAFNGGQFYFANNYGFVYTPVAEFKYIDNKIYEGKGFPPDRYVPVNVDSVKAGRDVQLSVAIKFLLQ